MNQEISNSSGEGRNQKIRLGGDSVFGGGGGGGLFSSSQVTKKSVAGLQIRIYPDPTYEKRPAPVRPSKNNQGPEPT